MTLDDSHPGGPSKVLDVRKICLGLSISQVSLPAVIILSPGRRTAWASSFNFNLLPIQLSNDPLLGFGQVQCLLSAVAISIG